VADEPQRPEASGDAGVAIGLAVWLLASILLGAVTGKMGLCLAVGIMLGLVFGGRRWVIGRRPSGPPA
jgi:hypothetical protein